MEEIYEQIIKGLQKYFHKSGLSRAVLGVSGGVDSSLTLKLAVDALGADKITAISMPEAGLSSNDNILHAKKLSEAFGVTFYSVPINPFLVSFGHLPWKANNIAKQNIKARVRMLLLYHYANSENGLVLGTSNRSEILLGYGTKYGDFAADIEVLGDLYKDEVFGLADHVGLPREIIEKAPTAELYSGQTDEAELGASYGELDPILKRLDLGIDGLLERGINAALIHSIAKRVEKNKHKSQTPPILKVKRSI